MPNMNQRKPRGKLDSIISKLRQTTPVETIGSPETGEEKQENEGNKEAKEFLQKKSKRKANKIVQYKRVFINDEDEEEEQLTESRSSDKPVENGSTEGGDAVVPESLGDEEPESFSDPSELVQSGLQESVLYENSLATFEKIAGVSLDQVVSSHRQENNGDNKNRLEAAAGSVEKLGLPRAVNCTACGRTINPSHGKFCRHALLHVVVCKKCNQYYNSGPFTRDEFGIEEQCRWCGDGGALICCDKCEKAFCKICIRRNLGKAVLKEIQNAPDDAEWLCYACDPKPLSKLIKKCDRIMEIVESRKSQKNLFKGKSALVATRGPNQQERRSRLSSLSADMGIKVELDESPTKKHFEQIFLGEDTSDEEKEDRTQKEQPRKTRRNNRQTDSDARSGDEENRVRPKAKRMQPGDNDSESESRQKTKSNKNSQCMQRQKQKQGKQNDKTGRNSETNAKKKSKVGNEKSKKSSRSRPLQFSEGESSDDFNNFVSMVKSSTVKSNKTTRRRARRVADSSDSTDEEVSNKNKKKMVQKQTRKRRRKVESSDSASDKPSKSKSESDSESESNDERPKKRKRKGRMLRRHDSDKEKKTKKKRKGKQKQRVRKSSDSEVDEEEEISPSKRIKGRREIRKLLTDDKLADETKKARRLEEERRKRLLERTQHTEELPSQAMGQEQTLVLETDSETKEVSVEVKEQVVQYLKPHQSAGIKFMYDCVIESVQAWKDKEPGGGCILAHCMGLGKTFQVVALVHTLANTPSIRLQRILVVCPLNTVLNWRVEFEKWLSVDDRLEVYVLQEAGPSNWGRSDMLKHWHRYGGVMILGYDMYRNLSQCNRVRNKHQKKIFKESLVDPGPELVICDEGHVLRNDGSAISRALNGVKTRRRIVLTGTPLQNNLIEYHCMVSFVKPNLLGTRKEFTNSFANPIKNGQCADSTPADVSTMKQRSHVLFKMLEGCVQRKDYAALLPFLPPKHEYVIKVRLCSRQRRLYRHFLNTFVAPDGEICKRGATLFSDYQALMRIWTHPWCLKLEALRRPERFDDTDNSLDDFIVHTDEDTEEEEEVESLKTTTSEDGSASNSVADSDESDEQESDQRSAGDDEKREGVRKGKGPGLGEERRSRRAPLTSAPGAVDEKSDASAEMDGPNAIGSTRSGATFKDEVSDVEPEKEWYDDFVTDDDQSNVELSGKLVLLMEILADAEAVGDKVLVFSHSLVTLDLIERALGGGEVGGDRENWCRGCDYFRMDGSTSASMRQRWAEIFNSKDNETARLFLISTKAGGLGINMIGANRVIMFDVSWNPSHDVQSIFRVFRFGQTKNVYVYRFVSQGTMEEKIYERQVTKLSLSQRVVDQHQIERHFTAADLAELYVFNPSVLPGDEAEDEQGNEATKTANGEPNGAATTNGEKTNGERSPSTGGSEGAAASQEHPSGKPASQSQTLPLPKDAVLADLINRQHPQWIVTYLEHDSLLQNIEEEELTEEERRAAWAAYEAEKEAATNPAAAIRLQMQQYAQQQLQQQQMQQQQQQQHHHHHHQRQQDQPAMVRASLQVNSAVLRQIQQMHQQQEAERQRRFREEMQRLRQEREQNLHAYMQMVRGQQAGRSAPPPAYQPPHASHAAAPTYQPPHAGQQAGRPAAAPTYQPPHGLHMSHVPVFAFRGNQASTSHAPSGPSTPGSLQLVSRTESYRGRPRNVTTVTAQGDHVILTRKPPAT